ncbi:MAG: hypothetical protein R6X10_04300 [Desulfobacterales bacterium]
MKRKLLFVFFLILFFGHISNAFAGTVTATVTADNYYVLGYGNEDGSILNMVGSSLTDDWNSPETYIFDVDENDYIYVAAWSDGAVGQGFLGQFVTESGVIITHPAMWEAYSTGKPFSFSTESISADIASANWGPINYSVGQGDGVWYVLQDISIDARWIWPVPLSPGSTAGEYHLFRTKAKYYPNPITADAGEDIFIYYDEQGSTTLLGTVIYEGENPLQYRWTLGTYILLDWTPVGENNECFITGSNEAIPPGTYELILEVTDGQYTSSDSMILTIDATPPVELVANAGENISVYSEEVTGIIYGTATYTGEEPLQYRWLWETTVLLDWTPAGVNNECILVTDNTVIPAGTYILTLEVRDGQLTSSDTMILTILNSAPHAAVLEGPGTYQVGSDVFLISEASDFDGDLLSFVWKEGATVISTGSILSIAGGTPVLLPGCTVSSLDIGTHYLALEVSDGINDTVSIDITVEVVDTEVPTLAPALSTGILWPPNHQMVDITIQANASDNSGLPVTLSASVISSEPLEGLGDGDMFPDWNDLEIDQDTGIISLQLRSERSGTGDGREYTIIITATDISGNSSSVEKIIIVPHDKSKK